MRKAVPRPVFWPLAVLVAATAGWALVVTLSPGEHRPPAAPETVELREASAPEPVTVAGGACELVAGWPGCGDEDEDAGDPTQASAVSEPAAPRPEQAPAQSGQTQQHHAPVCDRACIVERRANTPAERPSPEPYEPDWPDDEDAIDLGTMEPEPEPESEDQDTGSEQDSEAGQQP